MANDEVIVVEIEVGHDSEVRKEPTPEGLTHNWKVFVRGKNTKNIGSFVESIEFKLHESFSVRFFHIDDFIILTINILTPMLSGRIRESFLVRECQKLQPQVFIFNLSSSFDHKNESSL